MFYVENVDIFAHNFMLKVLLFYYTLVLVFQLFWCLDELTMDVDIIEHMDAL